MKFDCMKPYCRLQKNAVYQKIVFCMRVSALTVGVVLLSAQLLIAAPGGAQDLDDVTIHLELRNESLKSAFQKIEKQCNFFFAYKERQLRSVGNISIKGEKRTLRETLNLILANTAFSFKHVGSSILIVKQAHSSEVQKDTRPDLGVVLDADPVSGRVTDEKGKPIAGVTILEKGTTNGTQTDANGDFKLNTSSGNAVLEISSVGYATLEINLNNRSVVNLQLHQTNREMDQVVVVGYGTQRRKAVTGAVSKVDLSTIKIPLPPTSPRLYGAPLPALCFEIMHGRDKVDLF
jgi:hypothetical protein